MNKNQKLKIVLVSTWPPRKCGIATYSADLVSALRKLGHEVHIVCHLDGGIPGEKNIYRAIDMRRYDWFVPMYRTIEKVDPDIVHIQHEFAIYTPLIGTKYDFSPENSFSFLADPILRWKIERRPTAITYHSVYSKMTLPEAIYYDHIMGLATANIVHEPYQKEGLTKNLGRKIHNIFVIPHGAWGLDKLLSKKEQKKIRGWEEKKVVGLFGWWEPNKAFERVIEIWPKIVKKVPEALLVVAGDARPGSPTGLAYKKKILGMISKSPAESSIRALVGAFSPEEHIEVISAIDLTVLPYIFASQSGNLAHAYTAGVPAIVSGIEGLKSSIQSSRAGLIVNNNRELGKAIIRLLKGDKLRKKLSQKALRYVKETLDWPKVAEQHIDVYNWAIEKIQNPTQYKKYLEKRTFTEKDFK